MLESWLQDEAVRLPLIFSTPGNLTVSMLSPNMETSP